MRMREAEMLGETLKALANPVRIRLVSELSSGDKCVCELVKVVGIDFSNVSRHLTHLKKVGILSDRRDGLKVIYHLQTPCILRAFECALEVQRGELRRKGRILGGAGNYGKTDCEKCV